MICEMQPRDAVYMECGHGGICHNCALSNWKATRVCHLCREPISQVLKVEITFGSKEVEVLTTTRARDGDLERLDTIGLDQLSPRAKHPLMQD